LLCGAGRDNEGCIPRQMRRGSRESSTSFFGKNINSGAKNFYHDHPDRDCKSPLPEIILQHLRFQPLPIDATSYDFHCSRTSNGNAGEKSPSAAEAETAHMTVSSLDEFYNLFLANDAPHSFYKFHEKNGDEDIKITPWKKVAVVCDTQSNAKHCINKSNATMKEMERTITFQTRMTSSSSGPSPTNNKSNSSKNDIANSSSTTTPSSMTLGLIVVQRLIRHFPRNPISNNIDNSAHNHAQGRKYLKWILESHISFDYSDGNRGNDDDGNYGSNHSCSIFNNLGGKLSMGLGSLLVSNEVKCSTVFVRVILTEGDGITAVKTPGSPHSNFVAIRNDCDSGINSDVLHNHEGTEGSAEDTASPQSTNGYHSCFSHPLLLPTYSLCGGGGKWKQGKEGDSPALVTPTKKSPSKSASMSTNSLLDLENGCMGGGCTSPSELGASLLSAIKAKNAPRDVINPTNDVDEIDDFRGAAAELTVPETPPPTPPPSPSLLDPSSFMDLVTNTQKQIMNIANESDDDVALLSTCQSKSAETPFLRSKQLTQQDDDILSSNTSRGSLKLKHISSFEYAREPSVSSTTEGHMAMRRMILEKDSETKMFSSGKRQRGKSSIRDAPSLYGTGTESVAVLPSSSSFSSFPNSNVNTPVSLQGLCMRIEMHVRSPTTGLISNTFSSSTSTTFSSYCSPSNNNNNGSDSQSFGTSALTIPFHRSKGSFSSPLDEKILRNIRKRVSRTWISWAESWCMRIWEEEEAERSRRKSMGLAAVSSSLIPRRSSRNVRPVVRRLSSGRRKRDGLGGCVQGSGSCSTGDGTVRTESPLALSSLVSRSLSNLSMNSASFSRSLGDRWQPFDIRSILSDSSMKSFFGDRIEKWMFVVGKNGMGGMDIGIEVTCMFTLKQNPLLRVSSPPTISMSFVQTDVCEQACVHSKTESKTSEPIQIQVPEKNPDLASINATTSSTSRRRGWTKALSISGKRLMPK